MRRRGTILGNRVGDRLRFLGGIPLMLWTGTNTRVLGYHGLTTSYSLLSSVHFSTPICFDQHLVCTQTSYHHTHLLFSRSRFHDSHFPPRFLSAFVFLLPFVPMVWTHIIVSIPRNRCHVSLFFFVFGISRLVFFLRHHLMISCLHIDFAHGWI
jgi:hypothetical protein